MNIVSTKLDKKTREALPAEMFAFPKTRQCPINDAHHTELSWKNIDTAKGVTNDERKEARRLTLERALALGIETKDWNRLTRPLTIECMSLNIQDDDDHPNKMPFTGVLTKLDEPSDYAPGGSNGKRIIVTSAAARVALGSLLGMAVDFTPSFDGHDAQSKIGLITSADIVGNEVVIGGFVYAADFPDTAELIQALKDVLGFSFEAQRLRVLDMSADILTITELTFTGAAILRKDKAAYTTTSLAASAANEDINMTPEELKALLGPMLAEAVKPLADRLTLIEDGSKVLTEQLAANATTRSMVEPHATALESCAASMEAAGIGATPNSGHSHVLRRMADSMRAEAAVGKVPHVWRDHDHMYSSRDRTGAPPANEEIDLTKEELTNTINASIATAIAPLQAEVTKSKEELVKANEALAAANTKITDLEAAKRLDAAAPARKTVNPAVSALLSKAAISMPEGDKKLMVGEVDQLLAKANLPIEKRIMVKNELTRLGALT